MYCLGKYYNNALIAVESNYSTHPIKELERLGYTRQYIREVEDSFTHSIKKAYGFQTTKLTRPLIIAELVGLVREHTELFFDNDTLEEMLTFVRNEKGKPEAQDGKHDDCIMATAIAYHARSQQSYYMEADIIEDDIDDDDMEYQKGGWFD
jgi:phage terminase large subunit